MEREIMMTGAGGQGVQLAFKLLLQAGAGAGLYVQSFAYFEGAVRGGKSENTAVLSDAPILAPPIVPDLWGAIVMHPEQATDRQSVLKPGGLLLVNSSLVSDFPLSQGARRIDVPASDIATGANNLQGASLVALAAFNEVVGLVPFDSLVAGLPGILPAYRQHTVPLNQKCLELGRDYVMAGSAAGVR